MKKVILTEEQIKHIINEELGIADEVSNLSDIIERGIYARLERGINSGVFNAKTDKSNVNVDFLFKSFKTMAELYEWYKLNRRMDGYSYKENTIYITIFKLSGVINYDNLSDTIQHECSHYWECRMKGAPMYNNRYGEIQIGTENRNPVVATICKMLYYSNKNEINGYVNGAYRVALKRNKKYETYKDFISDNDDLNDMYITLKNSHNTLSRYDENNTLFYTGVLYLLNHNIVNNYDNFDDILSYLYKKTENGFKYLVTKIGRAYSLYIKKYNEKNNDTDIMR